MKHSWHDPHITVTIKSLFKAIYSSLGIFLIFFVLFHISGALYISYLSEKETSFFRAGITKDMAYLKVQGDEIVNNETLASQLLAKDRNGILQTLERERSQRSIGLMGIADGEGVIIGRTLSKGKYGDNVFLTVPAGRVVVQGESVESIEMTGFGNQIFMTTARPVSHEGDMIGALFVNYLLDDSYASRFRDTYLSPQTEVVFYSKKYGVYGNSFSDPNTRKLIGSYFNTGSDWVKDGSSGKTISFGDGTSYLLENIVFPGLEQSPGGALIFIPRRDISTVANIVSAFFTLLVFVILALYHHLHMTREERGWRYYVLLIFFAIPVFGLAFFAFYAQNIGRSKLTHIPYTLYNSTIRLQPEFGIYTTGSEQSFSIIVDTGDESINTVQAGILFDPDAVEMKFLNIASSTCSYVIEKIVDQQAGTARVSCVILNLGGGQHALSIADVVVVSRRSGTFRLSFDPAETKVLANDGLGTNVLRMSQDGSYRVDNFNLSSGQDDIASSTTRSFVIFSPSHPNESRWYNVNKAHFVWRGKADEVYRYEFDSSPTTVPTNKYTVIGSSVSLPITGDGIYYFHLQPVSGGPVAHYRVQSDMTLPIIVAMKLSQEKVFVGDVVRFSFDADDQVSGIQNNYYVDLGDRLFLPVGSQLFIPFLKAGNQSVTLRVYDDAGNYSEKTKSVLVEER